MLNLIKRKLFIILFFKNHHLIIKLINLELHFKLNTKLKEFVRKK